MYELCKQHFNEIAFPEIRQCFYYFRMGFEWLGFNTSDYYIEIVRNCGQWILIKYYDLQKNFIKIRDFDDFQIENW